MQPNVMQARAAEAASLYDIKVVSQMAPYSLHSALLLTRVHRGRGAIRDTRLGVYVADPAVTESTQEVRW
jgi:hypothetical protein